jgi:hypothetical protein
MKWYQLAIAASLGLVTVLPLGCTATSTSTQVDSNPAVDSPMATTSNTTNISERTTAQTNKPTVLSSGTFVDGEHPTKGTVRIVNQDGKRILELAQDFKTSTSGPDLVVILHRSDNVIGSTTPPAYPIQEGDYVLLAPLREYSGAQRYQIPANINLDDFKSAAIWCRRFNATFGAATLKP